MDPAKLRKRVWLNILSDTPAVITAVVGGTSLLASWAFGVDALLAFCGVASLLGSVGLYTNQYLFFLDDHTRQAVADLEAEALAEQEEKLNSLFHRLKKDDDPRDEQLLKRLRTLYGTFQKDTGWVKGLRQQSVVEIASQVEKLFSACIVSLERSLELSQAARRMTTKEGRRTAEATRERLLTEVQHSVEQMAKTIDGVQALGLKPSEDGELARIRRELDVSLDVARRVEERMNAEFGANRDALREM